MAQLHQHPLLGTVEEEIHHQAGPQQPGPHSQQVEPEPLDAVHGHGFRIQSHRHQVAGKAEKSEPSGQLRKRDQRELPDGKEDQQDAENTGKHHIYGPLRAVIPPINVALLMSTRARRPQAPCRVPTFILRSIHALPFAGMACPVMLVVLPPRLRYRATTRER